VNRTLIVARIRPGTEPEVARIFAASDATTLPTQLGVQERTLYSLDDLYVHLIEMDEDPDISLQKAGELPAFTRINDDLKPFISAYNPATWRTPQDAVAKKFYHWTASH
jgi:cyclase